MAKPYDKVQNPFDYLVEDHARISTLFQKLEGAPESADDTHEEIFQEINEGLTLHAEIEERNVYPALETFEATHDLTLESETEHEVIKTLLSEIDSLDPTSEEWMAKIKVLKENVTHHVDEEEKPDGLFQKAKKLLDQKTIEALGQEMEDYLEKREGLGGT